MVLHDGSGRVRAHEGDWVEAGGGAAGDGVALDGACARTGVFLVQSEPEVVAAEPLGLVSDGTHPGTGPARGIDGVLGVDHGCLLLREDGGARRLTVWPEGWTAGTDPDGVTTVRDENGVVQARTGEIVRVEGARRGRFAYGGSYEPAEPGAGTGCGKGAVFVRAIAPAG